MELEHIKDISQKIKNFYLNGSDIITPENAQGFIDVSNEKIIKICLQHFVIR